MSIGPVVAPEAEGAQALIAHLAGLNAGRFTRVDIDFDSGLAEWIESLGLQRVGIVDDDGARRTAGVRRARAPVLHRHPGDGLKPAPGVRCAA